MSERWSLEGITLVLPCYNEAARLDMAGLLAFTERYPALRLLLVDDGSADATWTVLQRLRAQRPDSFQILRLPRNSGKGEAVRQGILAALQGPARYVGFWDADLATPLEALVDFYRVLEERAWIEVAIGSRVQLLGRDIVRHPARHYAGRAFATVVSLLLRLRIYDTQCGAKIFRVTDETAALFAEPFRTRWIFDVELLGRLIRAHRNPGRPPIEKVVYEMPLTAWRDVSGSKLRKRDFLRAGLDLLRVYRSLHRPWPAAPAAAPVPAEPAPEPAHPDYAGALHE